MLCHSNCILPWMGRPCWNGISWDCEHVRWGKSRKFMFWGIDGFACHTCHTFHHVPRQNSSSSLDEFHWFSHNKRPTIARFLICGQKTSKISGQGIAFRVTPWLSFHLWWVYHHLDVTSSHWQISLLQPTTWSMLFGVPRAQTWESPRCCNLDAAIPMRFATRVAKHNSTSTRHVATPQQDTMKRRGSGRRDFPFLVCWCFSIKHFCCVDMAQTSGRQRVGWLMIFKCLTRRTHQVKSCSNRAALCFICRRHYESAPSCFGHGQD
jgi:hypothetical protein